MRNFCLTFLIVCFLLIPLHCYADGTNNVVIKKGTLLTGKLVTPIGSRYSREGDIVIFKIAKSFWYNDIELIPKGTMGRAVVTKRQKAGYFGVGGMICFEPQALVLENDVLVPLTFETRKTFNLENELNTMIAARTVGIFYGFLHGKNQKFPAGTEFNILVKEDVDLGTEEEVKKNFSS